LLLLMSLVIQFEFQNKENKVLRYFGEKSRYETMTDVAFLSDNLLVCADLGDKILYLVEFDYDAKTSKVISQLLLPHKADLIERKGNTIYIVNLNDYLTVCSVVDNKKLVLKSNVAIKFGYQYHGLCINPNNTNELFLASTRKYKRLTLYNTEIGVIVRDYVIPKMEDHFLKDVIFVDNGLALIIGSDNGPKEARLSYKSYIHLYTFINGAFTYLDGRSYSNCHMDSIVFASGRYYVTAQLNDAGCILTGSIEDNFIIPGAPLPVDDFPHGLAVSKSQKYIAHTSYSASSVIVDLLSLA